MRATSQIIGRTTKLLALLVALAGGLAGCVHRDDVHIRVTRAAGPGAPPLENLTVFVGGSKSWWPTISPGQSVSVVLPPEGEVPQVTMVYNLANQKRSWKGPDVSRGTGYAISIAIWADGKVTEQHCTMPCAFSP
jgi:hypothetical protein